MTPVVYLPLMQMTDEVGSQSVIAPGQMRMRLQHPREHPDQHTCLPGHPGYAVTHAQGTAPHNQAFVKSVVAGLPL